MKGFEKYLSILLLGICIISCDDHEYIEDTIHIGDIVCTNGNIVPVECYDTTLMTAAAIVFDVDEEGIRYGSSLSCRGYAVLLDEMAGASFADSLGIAQNTSSDIEAYDGFKNTYELRNSQCGSSLANALSSSMPTFQSAFIPSVAEFRLLYKSKDIVNKSLEIVGGTPITDNDLECHYWTSTEVAGQQTDRAWTFSLGYAQLLAAEKTKRYPTRPIILVQE